MRGKEQCSNLKKFVRAAFFTALTAVLSQIVIPLWPVPFNLATFSVLCAGAFLGAKYGALSQAVYVMLGLCGAPVFAGFRAGPDVLFGPTGGFLAGYIIAPFIIGLLVKNFNRKPIAVIFAMFCGVVTYFFLGALWYMRLTNAAAEVAFAFCVTPFIPGDIAKLVSASYVTIRLSHKFNSGMQS